IERVNAMDARSEYFLAVSKIEKGEYAAALEILERSVQKNEHFKTRHLLYKVCAALGRADEALEHLRKGYSDNPKNDRVACDYASELRCGGEARAARQIVLEVIARNPSYGPAREEL